MFFITQNPLDVPDSVLGQLGNRIQHALRAFTPRDQKAVRAAASTFRQNPPFDTEEVITQLGVGEALVSTLQEKGVPSVVDKTLICPPFSRIGPATPEERSQTRAASPVGGRYEEAVDRESAYEILTRRAEEEKAFEQAEAERRLREKEQAKREKERARAERAARPRRSNRQSVLEAAAKSVVRSVGSQVGRQIGRSLLRGILGSFMR